MIQDNGDGTLTYKGLPAAARQAVDALRDPYGVPTGVVPRLNPATLRPYPPDHPEQRTRTLPDFGVCGDPIAHAIDDYLLMERKARAWDQLREHAKHMDLAVLLDRIWAEVHPAQEPSTR